MLTRLIIVFMSLMLAACSGDSADPESNPALPALDDSQIQAINQAISDFTLARAQGRIVQSSREQNAMQLFIFTDGTELSIPQNIVTSVDVNADTWRLNTLFLNGQSAMLFFKGDSVLIQPSDIDLDPFGRAPLSALASFSTPVPGSIRIKVLGKNDNGISMEHGFADIQNDFALPILGLYADYNNQIEFHFSDSSGNLLSTNTISLRTEALTAELNLNILQNNLPENDDSVYMVADNKLGFDQQGELRWAITDSHINYVFRKLDNGNMTATNSDILAVYHFGAFSEITMLGEIIERYELNSLIHHEARLSASRNSYFVASNTSPVTSAASFMDGLPEEDLVVEMDRQTGNILNQWDFNTILDPERVGIHNLNSRPEDWAHINAVYFDDADSTVVVSARSQSTVAKIDYQTGNIKWLLSAHGEWSERFQAYLLTPVDAQGNSLDINTEGFWPSAQHAPVKLPNGDIMLYDNGNDRSLYTNENTGPAYSRMAQYRIDEQAMTVQLISTFPDHQDWYTTATGDVDYLSATQGSLVSFLWGSANTPRIVELDANGEVVFEVTTNLGANYYRAEKFRLYDGIH